MSTRHRRIILRPSGVDDGAWSRLADLLAAAVETQRRLAARSPHILAPLSDLESLEDGSLFVSYEPAEPTFVPALFDSTAPKADPKRLLRLTAGVFEALAAAHGARRGERPVAHGGICPGAILTTPDGQAKVADFGFAPAICKALGADAYVNLAIAPPAESEPGCPQPGPSPSEPACPQPGPSPSEPACPQPGPSPSEPGCPQPGPSPSEPGCPQPGPPHEITGTWEVLDPHTFDRDDRICGFIDPEKYGSRALGTFESGSDIIAAGFVLHLMAEHQHPYLYTDPDAHRLVEMSQFMGMGRYNGARRQDLRESTDPAVRLWCDLIAKTLSRLPKNRPTAAEIVQALSGEAGADQVAAVLGRETALPKPRAPRLPSEPAKDRHLEPTPRETAIGSETVGTAGGKKPVFAIVATMVVAIAAIGAWQLWPGAASKPAPDTNPSAQAVPKTPEKQPAANDSSRVPVKVANENGNTPISSTDHRLVEADINKNDNHGSSDSIPTPPQAKNENGSEAQRVVAIPDNENQAPAANAALVEEAEALTRKVARLEQRLEHPTHHGLTDIISERTIDTLRQEVRDYWGRAHDAGADEPSRTARDQVARLGEWTSRLASYELVLDMAGKPLDEQVRLLEAARADWPTPYVEDLIKGLPAVADLLDEADRQLGRGEWRFARFIIGQAERKAIEQKLGEQLAPVISAARAKLARDRRQQLTGALTDAAELLARIGDPPEPVAHLGRTEDAAAARNELDRFDLDFPTGARPAEAAAAAVEQGLLPWKVLTDEERATLDGLIGWTTFDLPVGDSTLSLVFVQAAPATGMLDPVWIGQTEVTVGLYREVTGALPEAPHDKKAHDIMRARDDNPVAFVPADQVRPFCAKIMGMFDNRIIGRPPSESEWTHALSAGGLTDMDAAPQLARFATGEDGRLELDPRLANFESDENYFTFAPGHLDGFGYCAPVRSYPPNRWLIYDMLGNVSEWVTTTSGSRLAAIGGSYVDKNTADHRQSNTRDQTIARGDIGIRLVVIAAP